MIKMKLLFSLLENKALFLFGLLAVHLWSKSCSNNFPVIRDIRIYQVLPKSLGILLVLVIRGMVGKSAASRQKSSESLGQPGEREDLSHAGKKKSFGPRNPEPTNIYLHNFGKDRQA